MTEPTKDILFGLLLATLLATLAAIMVANSGCKVADQATIEATAKKQRIEINEDLDLQLSSREGSIRSTVNSVFGMVLLVLAGQAGVVIVLIVLDSKSWQKKIEALQNDGLRRQGMGSIHPGVPQKTRRKPVRSELERRRRSK